jgi:uncharacterized membrane protein
MISKWRWLLDQLTGRLWIRATLFAIVGVATALLGVMAETFVPSEVGDIIGADAVGTLLNVLATSMLATTTFSLGVMISAYSAATSNVTPRATRLLRRDTTSQNVLSTFVGSFLFSLVGIITLTIEGYGERGRLVLFIVTICVIILVVVAILRWIEHVNGLGRVNETTGLVERTTLKAIAARRTAGNLGGHPLRDAALQVPNGAIRIHPDRTGYIQHIDAAGLQDWAARHDATIYLAVLPGALVHPGEPLGWLDGADDVDLEDRHEALRRVFTVADERTFEQDPRFGLIVLAEIASRALSPGVNDSGTAIDVLSRQLRVLLAWAAPHDPADAEIVCPRLYVPPLHDDDLFDDAFTMIARDGADRAEVQIRLQKALEALANVGEPAFRLAARQQARNALARADAALGYEPDRQRVRAAAAWI